MRFLMILGSILGSILGAFWALVWFFFDVFLRSLFEGLFAIFWRFWAPFRRLLGALFETFLQKCDFSKNL